MGSDKVGQRFPFFLDIELCTRSLRYLVRSNFRGFALTPWKKFEDVRPNGGTVPILFYHKTIRKSIHVYMI